MELHQETISFLTFILVGVIYGIIFDFFRALRKVKKPKDFVVSIQDILYFIIVGIILVVTMCTRTLNGIRIYSILSILLGVVIYMSTLSNKMEKIFIGLIKAFNSIVAFIFIPLDIFRQIFAKQIKFFKNIVIKCCIRIFNVINFNYLNVFQKKNKLVTKEGAICQEQGVFHKIKRKKRK